MMTSLKSLIWIVAMFVIMTESAMIIHRKPLFTSDNSVWPEIRETPNSLEYYLPSFIQWIRTFEMVDEDLKKATVKNNLHNIGKQSPERLRRRKILSILRLK